LVKLPPAVQFNCRAKESGTYWKFGDPSLMLCKTGAEREDSSPPIWEMYQGKGFEDLGKTLRLKTP
jgi:hypothetical protein